MSPILLLLLSGVTTENTDLASADRGLRLGPPATATVDGRLSAGPFSVAPFRLSGRNTQTIFPTVRMSSTRHTHTTCATRSLPVDPTLDSGILAPRPRRDVDPRIRGSVSPCLR